MDSGELRMARSLFAIFTLIAVLHVASSLPAAENADAKLEQFYKNYLEQVFALRPMDATRLGDHRFDNRLDDLSAAARQQWVALDRKTLKQLDEEFKAEQLSPAGRLDLEILRHDLKRGIWGAENLNPFEQDPRVYGDYITDSVYLLLTQSTLPKETNMSNAIARMEQVPQVIAAAKQNLQNPTRATTETAIRQSAGAVSFYEQELFQIAGDTPQLEKLKAAAAKVIESVKAYREFLEKDLLPRANGQWRLGPEKFAVKLDMDLDAGLTAEQVLKEADAEFARVHREMYVIARQLWSHYFPGVAIPPDDEIGRRDTTVRVLQAVGREHGKPEDLASDARATVIRIKDFIRDRKILTLPDPDRCNIIEMPEFQRGNSTAFLNPAPPLDTSARSVYAVSPPPKDWTEQQVNSLLEEYNRHMLQILTIHEAYPGHYVQLEYSNRNPSLIRRVMGSGPYIEGWAVYTEQMMLDQGYGEGDLQLRLTQLKFYLRAVTNAILDHRMHCTDISDEDALKLLTRGAFQSEGEAKLKIIRSKQSSCQLSTYFVGRMAMVRTRRDVQRKLGDKFELKKYHEALLGLGAVPVKDLTQLVLGELSAEADSR
jgi:uncharacterized protein (DUF885 family)